MSHTNLSSVLHSMNSMHCVQGFDNLTSCLPLSTLPQNNYSLCSLTKAMSFVLRELAIMPFSLPTSKALLYGTHFALEIGHDYACQDSFDLSEHPLEYATDKAFNLVFDSARKGISYFSSFFPFTVENTFVGLGVRASPEVEQALVRTANVIYDLARSGYILNMGLNLNYEANLETIKGKITQALNEKNLILLHKILDEDILFRLKDEDQRKIAALIKGRFSLTSD